MTTWVALLRGVNVGGITMRSADLADLFRSLGFERVRTVLASGNVRFDAEVDLDERPALKKRMETALEERFDYDAWIVLVTLDELQAAIAAFPFDADDPARQPYVVFCADAAVRDAAAEAAASLASADDPAEAGIGVVYWSPERGRSVETPFAKVIAGAAYRCSTTTRNLRTLAKIVAAN